MKTIIAVIVVFAAIVVVGNTFANHFAAQKAVADLWEEFRSGVEDCPAPGRFDSNGECTDSEGKLYTTAKRRSEAVVAERDKRLKKLGYCKAFGSWWESKMSFEQPTATNTVFYTRCW